MMLKRRIYGGVGHVRKRVRYGKKKVRRFKLFGRVSRGETKCVDVDNAGASPVNQQISTTASIVALNLIALGTDVYQRIGRKVELKSLHLIGKVYCNAIEAEDYARIMVIYDREATGLPVIADILTSVDSAGNTSVTSYDHLNPSNFERFKVLMDLRIKTDLNSSGVSTNVTDYSVNPVNVNRFINLRGLPCHFPAGSSTPNTGTVLLVLFGTQIAATSPLFFKYTARLRYRDG